MDRYDSHYNYLNDHLDYFWQEVFGKSLKEMWCAGIVDAHGDKGYCYRRKWEKAGIPFNHGMMLFMLTYTAEIGDRPLHESDDWIIENYERYLPLILKAEEKVSDDQST